MKLNLNQTKFVGLTMELDLKAREFKKLCNELERLKKQNINPNDKKLLELKQAFQKNHDEIVQINSQIKKLKEDEQFIENQKLKKYSKEQLFKKQSDITIKNEKTDIQVIEKNIFTKLLEKIKKLFVKK